VNATRAEWLDARHERNVAEHRAAVLSALHRLALAIEDAQRAVERTSQNERRNKT